MTFSAGLPISPRGMAALAFIGGLAILGLANPATNPIFPPCLFRTATGWLCPGCGSARAIHALLHGDMRTALQMNFVAVLTLPLAGSDFFQGWRDARGGWMSRVSPAHTWALVMVILSFGILRNVVR